MPCNTICLVSVRCEVPSSNLHYFEGVWVDKDESGAVQESAITIEELLLRVCVPPLTILLLSLLFSFAFVLFRRSQGAALMNTEYVYGLVIYTGVESKIFLNLNNPKHKLTRVETITNHQMYKLFVVLFFVCFFMALALGIETDKRKTRYVCVHTRVGWSCALSYL